MAARLVWRVVGSGASQSETADFASLCEGGTHYAGGEGDSLGWKPGKGIAPCCLNCDLWDLWKWRGHIFGFSDKIHFFHNL